MANEVGIANLPNQIHQRITEKGFDFTIMAIGQTGLGKSTLINSLFNCDVYEASMYPEAPRRQDRTMEVTASTTNLNEDGVEVRLTVVDTPGFGTAINNANCWNAIELYIQSQFEAFEMAESAVKRNTDSIRDGRVHCCLYFIPPCTHGLKALDVSVMKRLHRLVNIVPIIAKADTLTDDECTTLKQRINDRIAAEGIEIYRFPDERDLPEYANDPVIALAQTCLPFAICSSTSVVASADGQQVRGRRYPWGTVEVENDEHSDFSLLRNLVLRTYLQNLIDVTNDVHYERFRQKHLAGFAKNPSARASRLNASEDNVLEALTKERASREGKLAGMIKEMDRAFEAKARQRLEKMQRSHGEAMEALHAREHDLEQQEARLKQAEEKYEALLVQFEQKVSSRAAEQAAKSQPSRRRTGFRLGIKPPAAAGET